MKLSGVFIFLVWLLLFLMGLPPPMCDDLYFGGAAIHLAQGGNLSNPYCPAVSFLGAKDHFFVYLPFQFYAMAAWLKAFGISRLAFAGFQCFAGAVACIGLLDFIGPIEGSVRKIAFAVAVILSVVIMAAGVGFRPDMLGLALFATGLRLIKAKSHLATFSYSVLLFLSAITSPNIGILVPLVVLYALYSSPPPKGYRSDLIFRWAAVTLALSAVVLIFLWMIDFQLESFLTIFNRSRENATFRAPLTVILQNNWNMLKFGVSLLLPMAIAIAMPAAAWLLRTQIDKPPAVSSLVFFTLSGVIVAYVALSSGTGPYVLMLYTLVLFLAFLCRLRPNRQAIGAILFAALFIFSSLNYGRFFYQFALMSRSIDVGKVAQIRQQIEDLKPACIYLDSAAAAELYDFRLPPNALDCYFGVEGIWDRFPVRENFRHDSILVVSTQTAVIFNFRDMLAEPSSLRFKPLPFLGKLYSQMTGDPYTLVSIPIDPR